MLLKLCGKSFVLKLSSEVVLVDLLGVSPVLHKSNVPLYHVQLSLVLLVQRLVVPKFFFEENRVNFGCSFLSMLQLQTQFEVLHVRQWHCRGRYCNILGQFRLQTVVKAQGVFRIRSEALFVHRVGHAGQELCSGHPFPAVSQFVNDRPSAILEGDELGQQLLVLPC